MAGSPRWDHPVVSQGGIGEMRGEFVEKLVAKSRIRLANTAHFYPFMGVDNPFLLNILRKSIFCGQIVRD